jgi:bacterioferritin (cytochrome b1)
MSAPVAIIDTLNALLDSELSSVFRFMGEGSPYLSRATVEVRRPLQQMVESNLRHVRELGDLINSLGGVPTQMATVQREEQYLAFLSLKFLLPKLVDEKNLVIRRYQNALASLQGAPPEVTELLNVHLAEHREQMKVLEKAAEDVTRAK